MPITSVVRKKLGQPIAATANPVIGPASYARQREQAGKERVLSRRESFLGQSKQQHGEGAGAHARREQFESGGRIQRPATGWPRIDRT